MEYMCYIYLSIYINNNFSYSHTHTYTFYGEKGFGVCVVFFGLEHHLLAITLQKKNKRRSLV